jgi:signal transduction histidine kinase
MAQLGQLTATVAHEIRNPLGAVRTAAFLVERKTRDKGLGVEPMLQRIGNGVTRCDNIITQLLDFARSSTPQTQEQDFDTWLEKAVEEEAQKLPAVVTVECRLGLGGKTAAFDPGRLQRAVINLVANASEAMAGKGGDASKFAGANPTIVVATSLTPRGIEIGVTDNGPGIAEENLEKILEPLFTTKNFGTGLGLPAVQKIMEQHGGGLEVKSKPGEGACFTAWMPLQRLQQEAA